jgi:hypothetical protein
MRRLLSLGPPSNAMLETYKLGLDLNPTSPKAKVETSRVVPLPAEERNSLHRICATRVAKPNRLFTMPEKIIVLFRTYIVDISRGRYSPPMTATVIKDIHALTIESLNDMKVPLPCMSPPRLCYQNYSLFFNRFP